MDTSNMSPGWYIVDSNNNDYVYRGPYVHEETAAAVRSEMERGAERRNERAVESGVCAGRAAGRRLTHPSGAVG